MSLKSNCCALVNNYATIVFFCIFCPKSCMPAWQTFYQFLHTAA